MDTDGARIWTVTTLREPQVRDLPRTRCVAACSTRARAVTAVTENRGDMHEAGYYPYAVIEAVLLDSVYGYSAEPQVWFHWEGERYVECPCPPDWVNTVGFGIG